MLSVNFELIFLPKYRGGSGFFSREGGEADFQTIFENFDDLFFVDQIDFPSSPRTLKRRFFGQIFCAAGKFSARQANLVYIGAEGVFRKNLGSVGQKWISEKVSKGGPFGSAGGQIPEEKASAPPPP